MGAAELIGSKKRVNVESADFAVRRYHHIKPYINKKLKSRTRAKKDLFDAESSLLVIGGGRHKTTSNNDQSKSRAADKDHKSETEAGAGRPPNGKTQTSNEDVSSHLERSSVLIPNRPPRGQEPKKEASLAMQFLLKNSFYVENLNAKWKSPETKQEIAGKKAEKEDFSNKILNIKTRIFQKLKLKFSNREKLGLSYDFLNRNLMMIGDRVGRVLRKNKKKPKSAVDCLQLNQTVFDLINIEREILEMILSKSKILI